MHDGRSNWSSNACAQVLKLAQLRGKTAVTNEATILAVLLAWALLQSEVQYARQVLTEAASQWVGSLAPSGVDAPETAPAAQQEGTVSCPP